MDRSLATRAPSKGQGAAPTPRRQGDLSAPEAGAGNPPSYDLIELLFFAYRDFVGDADRVLETFGFGRAHHRVLHFVNRHPDLTIAELLDILGITKQSLNRVLKELLDQGYVESRAGESDRRQRRLCATAKGRDLAARLSYVQGERFERALRQLPEGARGAAVEFLLAMIDEPARSRVKALVWGGSIPAGREESERDGE